MPDDLDEAYHEYLWGEETPRAFARRRRIATRTISRYEPLDVQVGFVADLAGIVPR